MSLFVLLLLWSSKKNNNYQQKVDLDSLTFLDLNIIYNQSHKNEDLKNYLQRIDTMFAKDGNRLTIYNLGLIQTKLTTLLYSDSLNTHLTDSLHHKIIQFYRDNLSVDPSFYLGLSQMYYAAPTYHPDSVKYYCNIALSLCDSILKEQPYEENTYRIKVYTLLILDKKNQAKRMIANDKIWMKTDECVITFLQKLSEEIDPNSSSSQD